jgi:2-hydroxy-6-oxonona-2,4-dienedioate hydrolase
VIAPETQIRLDPLERRTRIGGVETYSRTLGLGRDVALLHGVGVSSRYWIPAQLALAATGLFRVHALDFPGFGKSATPPWELTVNNLAQHLVEWVEAVIPGEVDLVGQSLGCEFAVLGGFAMADRVGRIVLAAPNGLPDRRGVLGQLACAALDAMREPARLFGAVLPDYVRCGPFRILKMLIEQREDRSEEVLHLLRQPVLLVRGERDAVVSAKRIEAIRRLLPHAETATIPGAHGAHVTHAAAFSAVVTQFLAGPRTSCS